MELALLSIRAHQLVLLCVLAAASSPADAALSAREQEIVTAAQAETARAIEFLEKLVNINSGTLNATGVERVGRIMMEELGALGFEVRWVPMTTAGRAGHVVAQHKGSGRGQRL